MDAIPIPLIRAFARAAQLVCALAIIVGGAAPVAAEIYLLDGFQVGWRNNPHRMNRLGVELRGDGSARTTLAGGPWSDGRRLLDERRVHVWCSKFDGPGVSSVDGSTPWIIAAGRLRARAATPATARTEVAVDIDGTQSGGSRAWCVLLRGFEIDTDCTHPDGFTTKGLGVCIGSPRFSASTDPTLIRITFDATLRVEAGRLPFRRRLDQYTVRGRVHYTLVGLTSGHVTRAAHAAAIRTAGGVNRPLHSASRRLFVEGQPGCAWAALGLTGFDIRLNPTKRRFGGRYLRNLWVHNRGFLYEPQRGRMTFDSDVGFSNRSVWANPTTTISEVHFALLQSAEPST